MKVVLPDEKTFNKKQIAIYITIIVVCIISIIIAFYIQFYARIDIGRLLGFPSDDELNQKSEEEIGLLKTNFEQMFTNHIENGEGKDNKKRESDQPLIYTRTAIKESKLNSYDVEVQVPYLNIDNEKIDEYNNEIENFVNKANSILESSGRNIIYTVKYVANIKNDVVSLIIYSNLKEGTSAQRTIVQTYNYDLRNNKEITLAEVLRIENINQEEMQNKIKEEIDKEQRKVEDLKALGYNVYSRDMTSDRYDIKNSKEFYLSNNALYIIYAYGNDTFTSEMDLVII